MTDKQTTTTNQDKPESPIITDSHKFGPKKELFIKQFYINDCNISATCEVLKMSRNAYYYWMEQDELFVEALESEQEKILDRAETKLQEHIKADDKTCLIFYLKTKGKDRGYIERQQMEHSGRDGGPIEIKGATKKLFDKINALSDAQSTSATDKSVN